MASGTCSPHLIEHPAQLLERLGRLRFYSPANEQPIGHSEQKSWCGIRESSREISSSSGTGRQSVADGSAIAAPCDDPVDPPIVRLISFHDPPRHLAPTSRDVELLNDLFPHQRRMVGPGTLDLER